MAKESPGGLSRRERNRATTIQEIKEVSLQLMAEQGSTNLRFADIARQMGMTAPALYRYFSDRDALLTALITETWNELADTLESVATAEPRLSPNEGLVAVSTAYRLWARHNSLKFTLIFGSAIPGYSVPGEAGTFEAAARSRGSLEQLVRIALTESQLGEPAVSEVADSLIDYLTQVGSKSTPAIPAASYQGLLQAWIAIHGFISLEVYGHFDALPEESRDGLFQSQVKLAALAMGIK